MKRSITILLLACGCQGIESGLPAAPVPPGAVYLCEPRALDYGTRLSGTSSTMRVTCRASDDVLPLVLSTDGPPFHVRAPAAPGAIREIEIPVAFQPIQPGSWDTELRLASGGRTVGRVELSGVALDELLQNEPGAVDFGAVPRGSVAQLPITLRNLGTQPLAVRVGSPEGSESFAAEAPGPRTLGPAGTVTGETIVTVTYRPSATVLEEALLSITPERGPAVKVPLRGRAEGDPRCTFDLHPAGGLDFGARRAGAGVTLEAVVINTFDGRCAVLPGAHVEGDASFQPSFDDTGVVLPYRGATVLPVTYRPDHVSPGAAALVVPTESGDLRLPLRGTGIDSCVRLAPETLELGTVPRGCTGPARRVGIENGCDEPLQIHALELVPSVWPQFELEPVDLPPELASHTSLDVGVVFHARRASAETHAGLRFHTDRHPEPLLAGLHASTSEPPAGECP